MNDMTKSNDPTQYRRELKKKIFSVAMNEFNTRGIRAVKMDDIASALSISKRTLYEIYPTKEALLLECIIRHHQEARAEMNDYVSRKPRNAVELILKFYYMNMENLAGTPLVFFIDIGKYPQVVNYIRKQHENQREEALAFFQKGVEDGYFRKDVDYALISRLAGKIMQGIFEDRLYEDYDLPHIFRNIILLFLRGFCTVKGLNAIDKSIQEYESSTF